MQTIEAHPAFKPILESAGELGIKIPWESPWVEILGLSVSATDAFLIWCVRCDTREPCRRLDWAAVPAPSSVLDPTRVMLRRHRFQAGWAWRHARWFYWMGQCPGCLTVYWFTDPPAPALT